MISIDVFTGARRRQGIASADLPEYDLTPAFNKAGVGTFHLAQDHLAVAPLDDDASWARITHNGQRLCTAYIEELTGPFGAPGDRTYAFRDHWCILDDTLAFVAPEKPIAPNSLAALGQAIATGPTTPGTVTNQSGYYAWTGTDAETAVRDIVDRNLARAGYDFRWATDNQHRGPNPNLPDVRMLYLSEAILPVLTDAGLGIDIWREGATFVGEILEPKQYPQILTTNGPLTEGRWTANRVATTDGYPGGPGEEAARAWAHTEDPTRRTRFDRRIERVRDATGFTFNWPESLTDQYRVAKHHNNRPASEIPTSEKNRFNAYLQQAGRAALAADAPSSTLSVGIEESGDFTFGAVGGYGLGTRLRLTERLVGGEPDGPVFDDQVRSVRIVKPRKEPETVSPVIGGVEETEDALVWAALNQLAAANRRRATQK